MTRALTLAAFLFGGCAASTAETPIHTYKHSYRQTTGDGWATGTFSYGRRHGNWTWYDQTGRKLREGQFRDGVMHGIWTFYFDNGDVVTVRYRNGIQVDSDEFAASTP